MAITRRRMYENAVDLEYSAPFAATYEMAARQFDQLGDYRDSSAHAENCRRLAGNDQSDPVMRNLYLTALELKADGYYRAALYKLEVLAAVDYRNSRRQLEECQQALEQREQQEQQERQGQSEQVQPQSPAEPTKPRSLWARSSCCRSIREGKAPETEELCRLLNRITINAFLAGAALSAAISALVYFLILH